MAINLPKDTQENIEQIAWFLFTEHTASSAMLWHNELTPQQRYALRRYALDDYVAFLEMISRDYKSSKTRGRRESDSKLLVRVACSLQAKLSGMKIHRIWSMQKMNPKERDHYIEHPRVPAPEVGNQPKQYDFTSFADYYWIRTLWADTPESNLVREQFWLKSKPTMREFRCKVLGDEKYCKPPSK